MKRIIAFACVVAFAFSAKAVDLYYFQDALGDHDIANRLNWTKNGQTTVPDVFPPALDTATTGATHPHFYFNRGGTLSLPNDSSLTLQAMNFWTAGTDWTIDLGAKAKTVKLYGDCDSALWVGGNSADGSCVTLKRGTITRIQASQRHATIRLGANPNYGKRLSYFRVDGPNAFVDSMMASIQGDNCEFCITNGGMVTVCGKYSLRMNQRLPNSRYHITGAGSLLAETVPTNEGFFFGDAISLPDAKAGGVVVSDGGAVSGTRGVIGNRAGNFYALVDGGFWTNAAQIVLSACSDGTSTNNVFTARNKSTVSLSGQFSVGHYGGYDRAVITNCTKFSVGQIYLGLYPYGTASACYGYNSMTLVDTPFCAGTVGVGGYTSSSAFPNDGANACNNTLEIRNSPYVGSGKFALHIGLNHGGTNRVVLADSTYPMGNVTLGYAEKGGTGHNALLITNSTVCGNFCVGGQSGTTTSGSDGNVIRFVDTAIGLMAGTADSTFQIANCGSGRTAFSNRIELARSTWTNSNTYLGVGGWNGVFHGRSYNALVLDDRSYVDSTKGGDGIRIGGYGVGNRLEVKNGSTLICNPIGMGYTHPEWRCSGTNVLYVGRDSLVCTLSHYEPCPGGNILIVEDGTFKARSLRLHYIYSDAQGKTIDDQTMGVSEAEYGRPAREIWGSRFIFRGTKPVMRVPYDDTTYGSVAGCDFDRSCYVEFEFPEVPYAQAVLQSSCRISFAAGTNYRFDLGKVSHAGSWGDYVLAKVDDGTAGVISFGTDEFSRMKEQLAATASPLGFHSDLVLSPDGKTLTARLRYRRGLKVFIGYR